MYKLSLLTVCVFLAALVSSCNRGPTGTQNPVAHTYFKIADLIPDVSFTSVQLDHDLLADSLNYRAISSTITLSEGLHAIDFATPGDTGHALTSVQTNFAADTLNVVAAVGTGGTYACMFMPSNRQSNPDSARVRFANASPGPDTLHIGDSTQANLFGSVTFSHFTPYRSVTPGQHLWVLRADSLADSISLHVSADSNYTLYAIGLQGHHGTDSLSLLLQNDSR